MAPVSKNSNQSSRASSKDARIRVLRIIARMNVGGPAVQVTGLMQNLDNSKFEHKLVTGYVSENEADYLIENSIDIPVTRIDGLGRSIKPYSDFVAFMKLAKLIREFKPDIIHTHTAKAGVLGRLAWIFLGYKPILIHTFHGHLLHGYFGKIKTLIVIIIERFLGLFTDKFFAVGSKVAQDLIAVGIGKNQKFDVIPPGLAIKTLPDRNLTALKYKLDPNWFYCTFLGRVTDIKKPFRIIDIAKQAKNRNIPIHFLMVGAGELLDDCKRIIEQEALPVTCLGWINDVEEILSLTNLMLLTSENEGMPLSLIQAGMAGIPCIATDVGSVSEVIVNELTGYAIPYTSETFVERINFLLKNQDKYDFFSQQAKKYTFEHFAVTRLTKDHESIYLELLA